MYCYVFDKALSDGTVIGIALYLLLTQPAERAIWLTLPDVLEWPSPTAVLNYSGDTNDAAFVWGCVVRDVPMVNLDATLCLLLSLPFYWISRTAECERNWWHILTCVWLRGCGLGVITYSCFFARNKSNGTFKTEEPAHTSIATHTQTNTHTNVSQALP